MRSSRIGSRRRTPSVPYRKGTRTLNVWQAALSLDIRDRTDLTTRAAIMRCRGNRHRYLQKVVAAPCRPSVVDTTNVMGAINVPVVRRDSNAGDPTMGTCRRTASLNHHHRGQSLSPKPLCERLLLPAARAGTSTRSGTSGVTGMSSP